MYIFAEWNEFKSLDLAESKKLMKDSLLFDTRSLLNQKSVEDVGFIYVSVGKHINGYTENGNIVYTAIIRNGK